MHSVGLDRAVLRPRVPLTAPRVVAHVRAHAVPALRATALVAPEADGVPGLVRLLQGKAATAALL
eukprot:8568086-Alexandrium_andersonii.AAC.1